MSATSSSLINEASVALGRAGVDSPRLSSGLIMASVLECSRENLMTHPESALSGENIFRFRSLVARRMQGEPLAYIIGRKEFYGLDFAVNRDVLIPRPETEMLVELATQHYKSFSKPVFADIGTGSGAVAVALTIELPFSSGLACDISLQAVLTAGCNAAVHNVQDRICFFKSDLGAGIKPHSLDFIVSNPPYLSSEEFARISQEISGYEPYIALVSPDNGLLHIKRLESMAGVLLKKNGMIFVEIGMSQGVQVANIFSKWKDVAVHKDLAGFDRVLSAVKH